MTQGFPRSHYLLYLVLFCLFYGANSRAQNTSTASELVTWTCAGTPCPWGATTSGHALVWSASTNAVDSRLGYAVSKGVYLPASLANGAIISIDSGGAGFYAGYPDATSHRQLAVVAAGNAYQVTDLAPGEVLSVQSDANFTHSVTLAQPSGSTSEWVTWSCTGSPCPWGGSTGGYSLVWPESSGANSTRLGYTTSKGVYLPASAANGAIVWINSGTATVYAGQPNATAHFALASIAAGDYYEISGVASGEVVSVQSGTDFSYNIALPEPEPDPEPSENTSSELVTWTCAGDYCPWGASSAGHALVWPDAAGAVNTRFSYLSSKDIYLPAHAANGAQISITGGTATLYAGSPNASSHSALVTLMAGESYTVNGLALSEVLSVQGGSGFTYEVSLPTTTGGGIPQGQVMNSVQAYWRCNIQSCTSADWPGAVISWPSWSAYSSNNRAGQNSRSIYSASGELLHPFMGSWANGCQVTAVSGTVLIIEWERGSENWRETYVFPGQTHTIQLTSPENGAMIETYDAGPNFSVSVSNCSPQPLN